MPLPGLYTGQAPAPGIDSLTIIPDVSYRAIRVSNFVGAGNTTLHQRLSMIPLFLTTSQPMLSITPYASLLPSSILKGAVNALFVS